MPSPDVTGDPGPPDGSLPVEALDSLGRAILGAYLHVPFCAVRCGYCDFNTYTAQELGSGVSQAGYADDAVAEITLAAAVLPGAPPVSTVFFGGGTPTLLDPDDLGRMLAGIRDRFGLTPDVEVSVEANPDSVSAASLQRLREHGFNRISFGMQSAVSSVLATLDRTHDPDRIGRVVDWARAAGFEQVSLDLIYGTPGERPQDWEASLTAALATEPDHVSAYSLIVEDGTAMARKVRRGELPMPDQDDLADKYLIADDLLSTAGLEWYEVSNWARPGAQCRHNLGYWTSQNWLGIGPGAHAHVGGVRWWNVKHPKAYADRVRSGLSPAAGRETLTSSQRATERVMLEIRLRSGLAVSAVPRSDRLPILVADGLVQVVGDRVVLTMRGRLLADAVVRELVD